MNVQRRAAVAAICLEVQDLITRVEELHEQEETALEALPDSIRNADKGGAIEDASEALGDAVSLLEDVAAKLEEAMQ